MNSVPWLQLLFLPLVPLVNSEEWAIQDHQRNLDTRQARHTAVLRHPLPEQYGRMFGNQTIFRDSFNDTEMQLDTGKKRIRRCSNPPCGLIPLNINFSPLKPTNKPCTQPPCELFTLDLGTHILRPPSLITTESTSFATDSSGRKVLNIREEAERKRDYLAKFQDDCGHRSKERDALFIIDGSLVQPGEWTFVVALMVRGASHPDCGGTLITDRHVVTAAHCLETMKASEVRVRAGHHDLDEANPADDAEVAEIIIFHGYNPATTDADIAILRLTHPLTLGRRISVVCLPDERDHAGREGIVMGWGTTDPSPALPSQHLMQVRVPVITNSECAHQHRNSDRLVTLNMVCAGRRKTPGFDSCKGDSGGPLIMEDSRKKRWYLEGIVSWGPIPCGDADKAGVYSRVSRFIDWLYANVV